MSPHARLLRDRRAKPRLDPGTFSSEAFLPVGASLRRHWPEYLIEALLTATWLLVLGVFTAFVARAASDFHAAPVDGLARRASIGLVAGLAMALLIYSPWGRRSGSHLNPAITLAFLRLGKLGRWDALFYVLAQCAGALAGVLLARAAMGAASGGAPASWSATAPGAAGEGIAFAAELTTSTLAMLTILLASNHLPLQRWTGVLYATFIMAGITFESPFSGFGINPARALAAALTSGSWDAAWLYVLAPILGMQLAIEAYRLVTGRRYTLCAKLSHNTEGRCIFNCQHPDQARALALEVLHSEMQRPMP